LRRGSSICTGGNCAAPGGCDVACARDGVALATTMARQLADNNAAFAAGRRD
jgi:hypothetical protein